MKDVIYTGQVPDIRTVSDKICWTSDNTLMILEYIPTQWLDEEERKNGLCFKEYNNKENLNSWHNGRIFDSDKELCWSLLDNDRFQVVYTGIETDSTELEPVATDHWECSGTADYFLWGKKFNSDKLKQQTPVYLEVQIPRLLYYPVACEQDKARPVLKIVEYRDKVTAQVQHFRFQSLEVSK